MDREQLATHPGVINKSDWRIGNGNSFVKMNDWLIFKNWEQFCYFRRLNKKIGIKYRALMFTGEEFREN